MEDEEDENEEMKRKEAEANIFSSQHPAISSQSPIGEEDIPAEDIEALRFEDEELKIDKLFEDIAHKITEEGITERLTDVQISKLLRQQQLPLRSNIERVEISAIRSQAISRLLPSLQSHDEPLIEGKQKILKNQKSDEDIINQFFANKNLLQEEENLIVAKSDEIINSEISLFLPEYEKKLPAFKEGETREEKQERLFKSSRILFPVYQYKENRRKVLLEELFQKFSNKGMESAGNIEFSAVTIKKASKIVERIMPQPNISNEVSLNPLLSIVKPKELQVLTLTKSNVHGTFDVIYTTPNNQKKRYNHCMYTRLIYPKIKNEVMNPATNPASISLNVTNVAEEEKGKQSGNVSVATSTEYDWDFLDVILIPYNIELILQARKNYTIMSPDDVTATIGEYSDAAQDVMTRSYNILHKIPSLVTIEGYSNQIRSNLETKETTVKQREKQKVATVKEVLTEQPQEMPKRRSKVQRITKSKPYAIMDLTVYPLNSINIKLCANTPREIVNLKNDVLSDRDSKKYVQQLDAMSENKIFMLSSDIPQIGHMVFGASQVSNNTYAKNIRLEPKNKTKIIPSQLGESLDKMRKKKFYEATTKNSTSVVKVNPWKLMLNCKFYYPADSVATQMRSIFIHPNTLIPSNKEAAISLNDEIENINNSYVLELDKLKRERQTEFQANEEERIKRREEKRKREEEQDEEDITSEEHERNINNINNETVQTESVTIDLQKHQKEQEKRRLEMIKNTSTIPVSKTTRKIKKPEPTVREVENFTSFFIYPQAPLKKKAKKVPSKKTK